MTDLLYARTVSDALLGALSGPLAGVLAWRRGDLDLRDVQLRREPKGTRSWASLYLGLTSVLDVDEHKGRFRLRAHTTHQDAVDNAVAWGLWQSADELAAAWPDVLDYLDLIKDNVHARWTESEGRVHALVANGVHHGFAVANREASVSFRDQQVKDARCGGWADELKRAAATGRTDEPWWAALDGLNLGTSPDFLAVDAAGRLLVLEAKPASAAYGLVWSPLQVGLYAQMWAALLHEVPTTRAQIEAELAQRKSLGLLPAGALTELMEPLQVVPVVGVGPGVVSPEVWRRLRAVALHAATAPGAESLQPLEVWRLSTTKGPDVWRWADPAEAGPLPRQEDLAVSTYTERARAAAVAWKLQALPSSAQADGSYGGGGPYPFCLSVEAAVRNLLPEAQGAVQVFSDEQIAWHRSLSGGPTNHLVSSQVQCVNALFPMAVFPDLLVRALGTHLPIARPLVIEDGRYVSFEHVGTQDLINEGPHLSRGAHRTSTDAAVLYETDVGGRELALIEWKYTEQYSGHALSADKKGVREKRYREFWDDPDGPFLTAERGEGPLFYEDVFVEPFYQLARQQMLAWRMEQVRELDATTVRVLHIAPAANTAYQRSLNGGRRAAAGDSVLAVWQQMLRHPDRFVSMDSGELLDPERAVTSEAYRRRYGHR